MNGQVLSEKKVQIAKQAVIYLRFEISPRQRKLGNDRKEAICRKPLYFPYSPCNLKEN